MDNETPPAADTAFEGIDLKGRLLRERQTLLDLSTRNRLLNVPLRTANVRTLEVIDEKAAEVFRILNEGKAMSFLPGSETTDAETPDLIGPQPGDAEPAPRHTDLRLQTRLTSESLQKRLFDVWYDAKTLEQEQGVNILYLALGLLRWYDDDKSETPRHAPLVLLPVMLERSSASDKFRLKGRGEPPSPNLTLQARMLADFALTIEDFPDEDEVDLNAYAARVGEAVKGLNRWEVLPNAMVLGFFSFAKFLMYRDLDPQTWPSDAGVDDHPLIRSLLYDGFKPEAPLVRDGGPIDEILPPGSRMHVVDADSSQTVAIAEATAGRNLVIKGPPGTGKSQTITNIIASAVASGKKVLFVAEKMAALEVVHRRLQQLGLGPLVLELHANKISKRAVLDELKRTKDAVQIAYPTDAHLSETLNESTRFLNGFVERLHAPLEPSGLSPQKILGRLARWRQAGEPGRELSFNGAQAWSKSEAESRRDLAEDMAERLKAIGAIPRHLWRGVGADPFDPSEIDQLVKAITGVREALASARRHAGVAVDLFGAEQPETVTDLNTALAFLQLVPLPRGADRGIFTQDIWRNRRTLGELIRAGQRVTQDRDEARKTFNSAGMNADYSGIRADVVTSSHNLFRFLDLGYRRNLALLRSYLLGPLPKDEVARLRIIDLALTLRTSEEAFAALEGHGTGFGALWLGVDSDWEALDNVWRWRRSHDGLPESVWARLSEASDDELAVADAARSALYGALTAWRAGMDALQQTLKLDIVRAFGDEAPTLTALDQRYGAWLAGMEDLNRYIAFAHRGRQLSALGGGSLFEAALDGQVNGADFLATFDGAYARVLRDELFAAWPELKAFDGDAHERAVRQFKERDLGRIGLARAQIAAQHSQDRPHISGGIGPLGVLNGELAKKRAHMPLRQLLDRAGPAIQDLKPVFMMSPLSVAQFLKPGGLSFDLLVMDEASQVEPVDALGAIARVRQIIVVGDDRQLPPTAFFKTLTGEGEEQGEDEEAVLRASDTESILDLCLAKGAPYRMLNWHYRSKHPSLIAVSNREFYDSKLLIVPSPEDLTTGVGLRFHHLKDAWYDRGGTRTNPAEARIVAEAVIEHARHHPHQSLGVAAFSVAQRQAILRELEWLRRANSDLEPFFAEDRLEPFFVKNLENIQGDERDVIFISVGYGLTKEGTLAHNFGPLSAAGGERRLNVLISRAKSRCEVFCNFTGKDIDPERSAAQGVAALRLFLTFAETGSFDLASTGPNEPVSEIEADVARALQAEGFETRSKIGVSTFRVDLAVVDQSQPGRFALGLEFDGPQYRDAPSARDRDRLRRQVLEAHGWRIYRVWSADWYLRPKEELARIKAAIEAGGEGIDTAEPEAAAPAGFVAPALAATADAKEPVADRLFYEEAAFSVPNIEARSMSALAEDVIRVVSIEGPVHEDEIAVRIRSLSGQSRMTPRLKTLIWGGLKMAEQNGGVTVDNAFCSLPQQPVQVRDRSKVFSANLRKPEMLPPAEVDQTILGIVVENYGAEKASLPTAVSRRLGLVVTSAPLRELILERVENLLQRGMLCERDGLLTAS